MQVTHTEGVQVDAGETDYLFHWDDVRAVRRPMDDEHDGARIEMCTGEIVVICSNYDYTKAAWSAWLRWRNSPPPLFSAQ